MSEIAKVSLLTSTIILSSCVNATDIATAITKSADFANNPNTTKNTSYSNTVKNNTENAVNTIRNTTKNTLTSSGGQNTVIKDTRNTTNDSFYTKDVFSIHNRFTKPSPSASKAEVALYWQKVTDHYNKSGYLSEWRSPLPISKNNRIYKMVGQAAQLHAKEGKTGFLVIDTSHAAIANKSRKSSTMGGLPTSNTPKQNHEAILKLIDSMRNL